ncbi:MAG: extracellular solute-binding protein [Anaerolineae bacterium]|nr:extracellular solute-binding protein [Anaerolineae bacterium]
MAVKEPESIFEEEKMRIKSLTMLLLVVVTIMSLVVACGPTAEPSVVKETVVVQVTTEPEPEEISLVYITAGDVNMLALGQNVLAPEFQEMYPNVTTAVVHTGPGDAGSRTIFEKLLADKQAGKARGDVDVAMVHQKFMAWAMEEDLLMPYAEELDTWQYMSAGDVNNALGTNIQGYGMPMFHSQTALAYNPDCVAEPPQSYEELVSWVEANPGKFGYNGIKGGMAGVSFVVGWVYWKTDQYEKLAVSGPVDEADVATWEQAYKDLAEFNKNVVITAGNVGTLDALNRGEICMGPVWVDMFYTFMAEGKLAPETRLTLPAPGMPGQPMYFVIPKNAPHPDMAKEWVEYVTSPEVQGPVIIDRYNWYPGIDGQYVKDVTPPEAFDRLYKDITPEIMNQYGRSFPIVEYFDAMLEAYEQWTSGE